MKCLFLVGIAVVALIYFVDAKPVDNGVELVDGDMLLTKVQKEIFLSKQNGRSRRAALKDSWLWPKGEISYTFADYMDNAGKNLARQAMDAWMAKTCLKFTPRKKERAYIEFQYDGRCRARVGYTGLAQQKVSIGSEGSPCSLGSTIHELGHAIGFFHEHERPDRDNFVRIHWQNMRKGAEDNFKKDDGFFVDPRGHDYDYGSIMHYSRYQGNNKYNAVVVEPLQQGAEIGQRDGLSEGDIAQTNVIYKCNAQGDSELEPSDDETDNGGEKEKNKAPNPNGPKPGEIEE